MVAVWAAVAGLLGGRLLKSNRVGWMLAGLVLSHWVLDLVTHRPDLPLWPGGPVYGFGLWQSVAATLAVEAGLLVTGLVMYSRKTSASDRTGTLALYSLLALCVVIWVSGPFSPPPPNAGAVAGVALALWLLPFWSWWAERHRTARA